MLAPREGMEIPPTLFWIWNNTMVWQMLSLSHWGELPKHYSLSQKASFPLAQLILILYHLGLAFLLSHTPHLTLST